MPYPATLGVILAGGQARRMGGGGKALLHLGGRPLLQHVSEHLAPQCDGIILNANGDPGRFAWSGLAVVTDSVPGYLGPLAGILSALEWVSSHRPQVEWIVTAPADTPFLPKDLVSRLHEMRETSGQPLACAASGERPHFAIGLWPVRLKDDLRNALVDQGIRSIRDWAGSHGLTTAHWPIEPFDPFFNINMPEDLSEARIMLECMR